MAKSYRKDIHGGSPYYDDFNEDKKFLRIMSRPGFPLQAREVTQLQTILQNQLERFGDHLFEEGAVVGGGEITEASAVAIRLNNTTTYTEEQLKSFLGKTINNDGGVQATIIAYAESSASLVDDPYQMLFVNYTTGSNFTAGQTLTIQGTLPLITPTIKNDETTTPPALSIASNIIAIAGGIFYADGFLIKTNAETIAAYSEFDDGTITYRNYSNPSSSIGFKINREIITSDQDESLKDPSFGFYNFNSPGADRYKVTLNLSQISLTEENVLDFFELVRIVQGKTTKQIRYTDYAIFEDTLARRTYDESGHYTVSPFQVNTIDYSNAFGIDSSTEHAIQISPGKAYINGYEFETITPSYFPIKRAIGTNHLETLRTVVLNTPLKNYIVIQPTFNAWGSVIGQENDTFTAQRAATIQTRPNGSTIQNIGTCNIRSIQEMPLGAGQNYNDQRGEFRLYLWNIRMDEGKSFKDATHIAIQDGTTSVSDRTNLFRISDPDISLILENPGSSRQIFKAPIGSGLVNTNRDDLPSQFIVRKPYKFSLTGNSTTITSEHPFLDGIYSNHIVWYTTQNNPDNAGATMLKIGTDITITTNNTTDPKTLTLELSNDDIAGNGEGVLLSTQRWTSNATDPENNIRKKTVVETTDTSTLTGGPVGSSTESIITLPHADVFEVTAIQDQFGSVLDRFDLDVNQTNEAYFNSRLVLRAGFTCGTDDNGAIQINSVSYKRFSHSGEGPFTVNSYPITDTFTYDDIPVFTDTETGEQYSLADAYDFRPIAVSEQNDKFDNGNGEAQIVALTNNTFVSYVSYEHYMSRIDKLVLDSDRTFKLIEGIPSTTPSSPVSLESQMVLGEFTIPAYTSSPDSIKYRHVDNQRTTMSGINEIEQTQQYDQYWSFTRDLESRAINRAKAFKPDNFVVANSVLVDTFIGHNNAVTSVRDHNCSIDPENGTLRPAFESSFHHMGLTAADLGADTAKTTDNIYLLAHDNIDYTSNGKASDTIKINQFGIPDFQGTLHLSPSSDPYFSTIIKPKVMVNVVGEVDNWESNVVAYQRGRTRGFGSQWRDWETLWFGSQKRNDINIEHDSSSSNYSAPKRSSFVSRILSDKITRKIGNKIVDLSVIPYARSRTVTFTAKNLKPNTTHLVYFEGTRVVRSVQTDENGYATGSFDIPRSTFLTGKKLVRIQDQTTLPLSSSSADATYYAEGLLETQTNDVFSVRPVVTKRKAANSEDVSVDYFESNADNNLSATFNATTPLAQEIYVDPTDFNNGIMLSQITMFFANKPVAEQPGSNKPPVKLSIRPIYQGSPHPYKVLPFSEVTKNLDDVVTSTNYNEAEGTGGTVFEFSTPVYLKPGRTYAVCLSTNSPDYELYMGVQGERARGVDGQEIFPPSTIVKPRQIRRMHIPLNNGNYNEPLNQYFKMIVDRCSFNLNENSNPTITFTTQVSQNKPMHAFYAHCNEQVTQNVSLINNLTATTVSNGSLDRSIEYNKTIETNEKLIATSDDQLLITSTFVPDETAAVSPMIDGDRLGIVAVEYMANSAPETAEIEELLPNSRVSTNRSRYISRKVTLEDPATGMVVIVDGTFVGSSEAKVYVKIQGPDTPNGNFDDNNWIELYPEGNSPDTGVSISSIFQDVKPSGTVVGTVRFTRGDISETPFTQYQIKIVLMGENPENSGNALQIPVIQSIAAVPLRNATQDQEFVRRLLPPGLVLPFAGEQNKIPEGFMLCDGRELSGLVYPELFAAIGTVFGTGDGTANSFNIPDLRARIPLGAGTDTTVSPSIERTLGDEGGKGQLELTQANLPPHTHKIGPSATPPEWYRWTNITNTGQNPYGIGEPDQSEFDSWGGAPIYGVHDTRGDNIQNALYQSTNNPHPTISSGTLVMEYQSAGAAAFPSGFDHRAFFYARDPNNGNKFTSPFYASAEVAPSTIKISTALARPAAFGSNPPDDFPDIDIDTGSNGQEFGSEAIDTVIPYTVVNYIIKY